MVPICAPVASHHGRRDLSGVSNQGLSLCTLPPLCREDISGDATTTSAFKIPAHPHIFFNAFSSRHGGPGRKQVCIPILSSLPWFPPWPGRCDHEQTAVCSSTARKDNGSHHMLLEIPRASAGADRSLTAAWSLQEDVEARQHNSPARIPAASTEPVWTRPDENWA